MKIKSGIEARVNLIEIQRYIGLNNFYNVNDYLKVYTLIEQLLNIIETEDAPNGYTSINHRKKWNGQKHKPKKL